MYNKYNLFIQPTWVSLLTTKKLKEFDTKILYLIQMKNYNFNRTCESFKILEIQSKKIGEIN